ncbi:MAG TPA: tetratricopeptide repeat protein, partial [Isosphaeraceae bacterium]|nr:tetratricopeptide repeat protein [Isosphaeraceae bacterium]
MAVPRIKPTGWPCPIATPRTSTFSATACHPKPRRRSVFIPLNGQTVLGRANVVRKERAEALASFERARAISQKLADADPSVTQFQSDLAQSHNDIGFVQHETGNLDLALESLEQARAINQKLAD